MKSINAVSLRLFDKLLCFDARGNLFERARAPREFLVLFDETEAGASSRPTLNMAATRRAVRLARR
jgi:hypothetical protein